MMDRHSAKSLDESLALENAVKDTVKTIQGLSWRDYEQPLHSAVSNFSESMFSYSVLETSFLENCMSEYNISYWQYHRFCDSLLIKFSDKSDAILRSKNSDSLKVKIIEKGFYSNVSMIDVVALNSSGDTQAVAATYCSIDALRKIADSKNHKVRKIAYERLGPVECLDLILSDKKADIREFGVRMAPFGYEKLNLMTKEIARGPFSELVKKISSEYLPMLLANRNLKNKWISSALQARLTTEENKND